jgi:hypothetical protein
VISVNKRDSQFVGSGEINKECIPEGKPVNP